VISVTIGAISCAACQPLLDQQVEMLRYAGWARFRRV
jgi:hypothetical protein